MREVSRAGWRWLWTIAVLAMFLSAGYPAWGQSVFINEIHYDNLGTDAEEVLEVAGPAGTDIKGWSLVLYNGKNGMPYRTIPLAGSIPFGTLSFSINRIENGAPDGIVPGEPLHEQSHRERRAGRHCTGINPENPGLVIHFMSYEGGFTAASGPAEGLAATDIGVRESNTTQAGHSLQLRGSGSSLADFAWHGPGQANPGLVNAEQTFVAPPGETTGGGQNPSAPVEVVKESR